MKKSSQLLFLLFGFLTQYIQAQDSCRVYIGPSWNGNSATLSIAWQNYPTITSYIWSTGQTTPTINTVKAGDYCVTVTFSGGCKASNCYKVIDYCGISIHQDQAADTVSVSTGTYIPATYKWSNGATTKTIKTPPPGEYCVTATFANGCTATTCGFVHKSCWGWVTKDDDMLKASVQPADPKNTYAWNTGETTPSIKPLSAGVYCVTITTPKGCTETTCTYFTPLSKCPVEVENNAGVLSVKPNGMTPTKYAWSTGETTPSIQPDINANVCVTVTYSTCTASGCAYAYRKDSCSVGLNLSSFIDSTKYQQIYTLEAKVFGDDWTYDWGLPNYGEHFRYIDTPGQYCITVTNTKTGCTATQCYQAKPDSICTATITATPIDYESYQLEVKASPGPIQSISWGHGPVTNPIKVSEPDVYLANVTMATGCKTLTFAYLDNNRLTVIAVGDTNTTLFESHQSDIFLIRYDTTQGGTLTAVDRIDGTSSIYSSTTYGEFLNVKPGKYLIKAALKHFSTHYKKFLPTYHQSSALWSGATPVVVHKLSTEGYPYQQVVINLIRGQNPGGPGFIGGRVSDGANIPPEGNPNGNSGGPLPDMTIILTKPDGTPVASTTIDALGNYSFSNLPYGTYIVWIDIPGLKPVSSSVTLSATRPLAENTNFKLGKSGITTAAKEGELQQIARIYPNPVTDVVWLELNAEAQLLLSNSQGQLIQQLKAPVGTTSLDMAALPSGLYFISVQKKDSVQTFKVVKR